MWIELRTSLACLNLELAFSGGYAKKQTTRQRGCEDRQDIAIGAGCPASEAHGGQGGRNTVCDGSTNEGAKLRKRNVVVVART